MAQLNWVSCKRQWNCMSHRGEPLPVSSEVDLFLKKENYDKKMNKFQYLKALKFDKLIHETNEIKSTKPTILTWQKQNTFNTWVLPFPKFWTYGYLIPSAPLFVILTCYYGFLLMVQPIIVELPMKLCFLSFWKQRLWTSILLPMSRCMGKEPALKSYSGPEREVANEPTLSCSVNLAYLGLHSQVLRFPPELSCS